jgi:arginase family enzyme
MTDHLPHDGSRPSLALRTDGLRDLRALDAGDMEMHSGDIETALPALESAVETVTRARAIPVVLGGDHSIAFADATGVANVPGHGRVSMLHFDAHATPATSSSDRCGATVSRCAADRVRRAPGYPALPVLAHRPAAGSPVDAAQASGAAVPEASERRVPQA